MQRIKISSVSPIYVEHQCYNQKEKWYLTFAKPLRYYSPRIKKHTTRAEKHANLITLILLIFPYLAKYTYKII